MTDLLLLDQKFMFLVPWRNSEVYFDDKNCKVFVVNPDENSGKLHVTAKDAISTSEFHLPIKPESVHSVKLSPLKRVVAIQRSGAYVDFMTIQKERTVAKEFSQSCKAKNPQLFGIEWVGENEILFITNRDLELYSIQPEKSLVKSLKVHNISLNWFVYSATNQILIASSGAIGNILNPFLIKTTGIVRLPKFEVELYANPQPPRLMLLDRDVTVATIYGEICVLVLRHNPRPGSSGAEILIYKLSKETSIVAKKTWLLQLGVTGRFAMHVIDSLVIVHQQATQESTVFDLAVGGAAAADGYTIHQPLLTGQRLSLASKFSVAVPSGASNSRTESEVSLENELYSPNWVIFQPNVIVDAQAGCVWTVRLNLEAAVSLLPDRLTLFEFLLHRIGAKMIILKALCASFLKKEVSLLEAGKIFDRFCGIYQSYLLSQNGTQSSSGAPTATNQLHSNCLVIDQSDFYSHVFYSLSESERVDHEYLVNLVIEYLLSLQTRDITPQLYLHEVLVGSLVHCQQYQRLLQLLQYHVLPDSKPLAFLLLSLETQYPPALQLAVDMLLRLNVANEEIVEILLAKEKVIEALKFIQVNGNVDARDPLKFIEAAWMTSNKLTFYAVFKFFEQRSLRYKGTAHFGKGELYDKYLRIFSRLYRDGSFGSDIGNDEAGRLDLISPLPLRRLSLTSQGSIVSSPDTER